jgi:DNA-binding XRE family transcriptional regulator/molybdate-binding protein
MKNRVHELRRVAGLSQSELAAAAGVPRATVGAVESGRHSPGVEAALALADALGTTVERLFGIRHEGSVPMFGRAVPEGAPVVGVQVGERISYAPVSQQGVGGPYWAKADGVLRDGRVELFHEGGGAGFAVAGCDPALGLAAGLLPSSGTRRVVPVHASSGAASDALAAGTVHAAVVHGPPRRLGKASRPGTRVRLARWEVGIAARRGEPISLEAAAAGASRVAHREPGAASQRAFDRAIRRAARKPAVVGPRAGGHIEAARLVAWGAADLGVTMRAAALALGLEFRPLEEHVVELWLGPVGEHPGGGALCDLLATAAWRKQLAALGGYDTSEAGSVVA